MTVFFGGATGVDPTDVQRFTQNTPGVKDRAEQGEAFGTALAVNDLDGDGAADLAVGVPGEDGDAGAVAVLYGLDRGLEARGSDLWSQDSSGVAGEGWPLEAFGQDLVLGDFDDDGYGDLAAGAPLNFSGPPTGPQIGSVTVIPGTAHGLDAADSVEWTQDKPGVRGAGDPLDRFGWALTRGDFNGDRITDLAVGVPGEGGTVGAVAVFYASIGGLTGADDQLWSPGSRGLIGDPEPGEEFGRALVGR